ncbi:ABC transporter permease [Halocatena marina]|uniref:ABC transporter permease n=1 Tax=Halocatena marina TaxID=2934937 RepID=A0ABD5YKW7_9EURY|nr:ABC transporter permease [Halocatena marina]
MDLIESFRLAWRAVQGYRLRSVLTTLGIVIGVAAVILFVTLGASLQAAIVQEVAGDQKPELTVAVVPKDGGMLAAAQGRSPVFTEHDVKHLRRMPGVEEVYGHEQTTVSNERSSSQTIVYSGKAPPNVAPLVPLSTGRSAPFGPRPVMVSLSPGASVPATVSGHVGTESVDGRVNTTVVARVSPEQSGANTNNRYSRLTVKATNYRELPTVRQRVNSYLRTKSDAHINKPDSSKFLLMSNEQLVTEINNIVGTITTYIIGVALLSWLVGSIGIINIMLMSVTERTRSIGIMKAVGAQNRDILQLFLVEAITLGVIGAAIGTVVGIFGGVIATDLLSLPLVFRLQWAVFAVLSGIAVGIVAGVYPAWRAARTDPIEALRYQ